MPWVRMLRLTKVGNSKSFHPAINVSLWFASGYSVKSDPVTAYRDGHTSIYKVSIFAAGNRNPSSKVV